MPTNKRSRYGLQNTTATVDEQHPNMCGIPLLAIIPASARCGSRDFFRSSASGLRERNLLLRLIDDDSHHHPCNQQPRSVDSLRPLKDSYTLLPLRGITLPTNCRLQTSGGSPALIPTMRAGFCCPCPRQQGPLVPLLGSEVIRKILNPSLRSGHLRTL